MLLVRENGRFVHRLTTVKKRRGQIAVKRPLLFFQMLQQRFLPFVQYYEHRFEASFQYFDVLSDLERFSDLHRLQSILWRACDANYENQMLIPIHDE